nr:DUF4112 domain-containing protein [Oceanococcus sp. HetDA_MAG_MS8]
MSTESVPAPGTPAAQRAQLRAQLDRLAYVLDELVHIPGTPVRVGLDAVIGLVPVVGDLLGMALGLWLVGQARSGGVPNDIQRKMLRNLVLETLVGFVPVVGDVFDVAYRANSRNRDLVATWLEQQEPMPPRRRPWRVWALLIVILALAAYSFRHLFAG